MRIQHSWSAADDELMRLHYRGDRQSIRWLAERIGCTEIAVKGRVQRLGLALAQHRKWTPEEDRRLRDIYHSHRPETIARMMGRTIGSIVNRSKRLKINRRVHDGWYTLAEACEILGRESGWVREKIKSGDLTGRQSCRQGVWYISERALVAFIRRFPQDLAGRNVDIIAIVDLLAGLLPPHKNGDGSKW